MTPRSMPGLWATVWPPVAALCVTAATVAAAVRTVTVFNSLALLYVWILIIVILASCCIGLATRTPRRARQHRLGRPATAVSVAVTSLCAVVSGLLIIAVLFDAVAILYGD